MTDAPRQTARPVGSPELVWLCGARNGKGKPGIITSTPGRRCSHGCKKCFAPCGKSGCGTSCVQCGRQWAASGVGWATSIVRGDGVVVHGVEAGCKAVTRCLQGFQGCRTRKTWLEECRE